MRDNYWKPTYRSRMGRRRFLAGASASGVGIAALALAGCGDDDSSAGAPTAAGGGSTAPTPTVDLKKLSDKDFFALIPENPPKDWEDKDVKTGGQLIRLSNREAATLDFMTGVSGATADMITPVYNGLVRLSARQGMKDIYAPEIEPDLASAWETPDKTTITFSLNPGVKFQNVDPLKGRALSVDDIKFSLDRGKTFAKSVQKTAYSYIDKVEDVGAGKVKLTLKQPNAAMLLLLGTWVMRIMPPEIGQNPDLAQQKAVGTGGFILDKRTPNVEAVFKKNPDYFKKDKLGKSMPYLDGYTTSFVSDPATITTIFQGGKADFHYFTASPLPEGISGLRAFMDKNPTVVVQKHSAFFGAYSYVPHYNKPPFNDPRVRRALSMSINRQAILDGVFLGQGLTFPFFSWPAVFAKKPTLGDLGQYYKYDAKTAKQLLTAAGYANGLELELAWGYPQEENQVVLFKQYAEEAGFKINLLKSADQAAHLKLYSSKAWKDLVMIGRGANYPDVNEFAQYYTPGSPLNYGDIDDPELTALMDKQQTLDGSARRDVHKQIFDRLVDQVYEVSHTVGDGINFWHPWVKNWLDTGWNSNAGTGSGQMDSVWRA